MGGHYMILGRAVKNEYLTLATLGALGAVVALTTGGDKAKPQPTTLQQVKEAVKIGAGSSEEDQFIRKFIADAEKDAKH